MISSVVTPNSLFCHKHRLFQHFSSNCNCGVNRVSDNTNARFRAGFRNLLYRVFHDAGVNVKQVGTIHTRFTRYTCRDKNDICAFQRRSRIFTRKPLIFTAVGIWLRSTATPGVTGAISYRESSEPEGSWVLTVVQAHGQYRQQRRGLRLSS